MLYQIFQDNNFLTKPENVCPSKVFFFFLVRNNRKIDWSQWLTKLINRKSDIKLSKQQLVKLISQLFICVHRVFCLKNRNFSVFCVGIYLSIDYNANIMQNWTIQCQILTGLHTVALESLRWTLFMSFSLQTPKMRKPLQCKIKKKWMNRYANVWFNQVRETRWIFL